MKSSGVAPYVLGKRGRSCMPHEQYCTSCTSWLMAFSPRFLFGDKIWLTPMFLRLKLAPFAYPRRYHFYLRLALQRISQFNYCMLGRKYRCKLEINLVNVQMKKRLFSLFKAIGEKLLSEPETSKRTDCLLPESDTSPLLLTSISPRDENARISSAGQAGACVAVAVAAATTTRCSCFTAVPRGFLPPTRRCGFESYTSRTPVVRRLYSSSSDLAAAGAAAADSRPSERASAPTSLPTRDSKLPGSPIPTRRQRRKVRRKTRLNSTKERDSSTEQLPVNSPGQDCVIEVEASRAGGAIFPQLPTIEVNSDAITPQYGSESAYDADLRDPDASPLETRWPNDTTDVVDSAWLDGARDGGASAAAAAGMSTAEHSSALERQQLLDMTQPPAELLKSAESRQFEDSPTATGATALSVESASDGLSLWASRGMLAAAAMIYGTNFGCVKLLEEGLPMSLAAALRFSVSVVPFIPALLRINRSVLMAGAEIGFYNWLGYYAQSVALTTTTASKACFIGSLAVVVVPALDTLAGVKKTNTAKPDQSGGGILEALNGPWFPAFLAAAGVASLELVGAEGDPPNVGDAWALVQPVCFALAFWRMERNCRAYPKNAWGLVGAQMLIIATLSALWCSAEGQLPSSFDSVRDTVFPASGSLSIPITILWTGIVTTALTVYGETLALQKISAAESTIILSTQPIWGTAFASVLLGEAVGWNTGLGAVLIISACTWKSVGPALQNRLLSMIAATGAAETFKDELKDTVETVGTVVKDLVQDHM